MDFSKLGTGGRIAGISAIVLLIAMFALGWFQIESVTADDHQGNVFEHPGSQLIDVGNETGGDVSADAWEAFGMIDIFLGLTALAALALVLVRSRGAGDGSSLLGIVVAGLGGLCVLLLVYRLIDPPELLEAFGIGTPPTIDLDTDVSRQAGVYVGLAACAGITYGGFRVMTEDVPKPSSRRS